jgi:hypothetical protein
MNAVFDAHNAMLRQDLRRSAGADGKREIFSGLVASLRDLTLTPAAW